MQFPKLNFKEYKKTKVSWFTKNEKFFFITQTINKNSKGTNGLNKKLQKMHTEYFKVANSATSITFKSSVFKNFLVIFQNLIAFLKPQTLRIQKKQKMLQNFKIFSFNILVLKINSRVYTFTNLDKTLFFSYNCNKFLFVSIFTLFEKQIYLKN